MFRDIYADRYEVRVRAESGLWVWEVWDLTARRLVHASIDQVSERRFLSSRDAYAAGREYAAALRPPAA